MEISWILLLIFCLFFCILVTLFVFVVNCGLFSTVEVKAGKPSFGELTVAYKFCHGPYSKAGELFTETSAVFPGSTLIGIYYDDPQKVEPAKQRYIVGAIIGRDGEDSGLKENMEVITSNSYKVAHFPAITHGVLATFPFYHTISILIAVARVYPKIKDYVETRNLCAHPFLEVYEKEEIQFVGPLSQQLDFYVPEARLPSGEDDDDEDDQEKSENGSREHSQGSDVQGGSEPPRPTPQCSGGEETGPGDRAASWPPAKMDDDGGNGTPSRGSSQPSADENGGATPDDASTASSFEEVSMDAVPNRSGLPEE